MDKRTIDNFLKAYKDGNGALKPDVKSFIKPSHLEELSPLFECHLEAVVVRKDEFHELEGGKTYMPRKETMDKFAQAAGVSYNEAAEKTWKEGDACYVGRSQGMVMGPDGKWILGDVCEYEFDADVRTEEARLNGKPDWSKKDQYGRPGRKDYTEKELEAERIQFRKVGRQRANTGARNRATVSILGMSTGFKGLFDKNEGDGATRTFLFSRVIVNAKNEMVMNAMLSSLGSNAQALFGPAPAAKALAAPQSAQGAPAGDEPFTGDARPAANATTTFDDDIPFGDKNAPAGAASASDEELDRAMVDLEAWANHPDTPKAVAEAITKLMDRGENRRDVILAVLQLLQNLSKTHAPKIVGAIATMILDEKADANAILALSGQIDTAIQNYKGGQK